MRLPSARLNKVEKFFHARLLKDTNADCETLKSRIHSVEFQWELHFRTWCTANVLGLVIYRIYTLRKCCWTMVNLGCIIRHCFQPPTSRLTRCWPIPGLLNLILFYLKGFRGPYIMSMSGTNLQIWRITEMSSNWLLKMKFLNLCQKYLRQFSGRWCKILR